jgi:hypothetical protein
VIIRKWSHKPEFPGTDSTAARNYAAKDLHAVQHWQAASAAATWNVAGMSEQIISLEQ